MQTLQSTSLCISERSFKQYDDISENDVYNRLQFLQTIDEIIVGNITSDSMESVIETAATAVYVDNSEDFDDDEFPSNDELLEDLAVMEYVAESWRDSAKEDEWAEKISSQHQVISRRRSRRLTEQVG